VTSVFSVANLHRFSWYNGYTGGEMMPNKKKPCIATNDVCPDQADDEDTVASRVRELREYKGWSQSQLAEKISVVRSQITRLESGETQNLHSDLLIKLAKAFGVTADYLLCLSDFPHDSNTDIGKLGLSEDVVKKLVSGTIDCDILNRLLESKDFGVLCSQIRIFFDDTYTEGFLGRNALLDYGVTSLQQFVRERPDKRSDARETLQLISTQKASADEINAEKISKSFMRILKDVRIGIREKKPTTPNMTHDAMTVIQANIVDKPLGEVTPDDITEAIMAVIDSRCDLQPGPRNMIRRFVCWFMRHFGGSRHNHPNVRFQAHQSLEAMLDEAEKEQSKAQCEL